MPNTHHVLVAGAGIGGLTLALQLHARGLPGTLLETAPAIAPLGVGINILPHAARELHRLGLGPALDRVAIRTREARFYNRFGQLIYVEPVGRAAGYEWPQYSVHRGDLQTVLADAVRAQLYPDEGPPRYSGHTMWRGTTVAPPFLGGASMVRAGWLSTGKMVVCPIRDDVDHAGNQLVNWVAELETPQRGDRDWTRAGAIEEMIGHFADWHFDWLDVPALIRGADGVLEYPMVDQDPLPRWSFERVSLLGDAAHPMVPRGSNGAGQAILDTRSVADQLAEHDDPVPALRAYDAQRRDATAAVVRLNRTNPPDAILREVYQRTGDKPFDRIEDVMSPADFEHVLGRYRTVAGYAKDALSRDQR